MSLESPRSDESSCYRVKPLPADCHQSKHESPWIAPPSCTEDLLIREVFVAPGDEGDMPLPVAFILGSEMAVGYRLICSVFMYKLG